MDKKILITGASGALGREIHRFFPDALAPTHKELTVESWADVVDYFQKNKPIDIVIHLAAYISPPKCELNKSFAWHVNVQGTRQILDAARLSNPDVFIAYASTPCVFAGDPMDGFYEEYSIPAPVNYYGLTKLIGEQLTLNHPWSMVFRANFISYHKYKYQRAFKDRHGTYLFAHQVAKGLHDILDLFLTGTEVPSGIYHIVGDKELSMYDLAKLCPESEMVESMTIDDHIDKTCHLTMNMRLKSTRWRTYSIKGEEYGRK